VCIAIYNHSIFPFNLIAYKAFKIAKSSFAIHEQAGYRRPSGEETEKHDEAVLFLKFSLGTVAARRVYAAVIPAPACQRTPLKKSTWEAGELV
jgi:hypothetical protein